MARQRTGAVRIAGIPGRKLGYPGLTRDFHELHLQPYRDGLRQTELFENHIIKSMAVGGRQNPVAPVAPVTGLVIMLQGTGGRNGTVERIRVMMVRYQIVSQKS